MWRSGIMGWSMLAVQGSIFLLILTTRPIAWAPYVRSLWRRHKANKAYRSVMTATPLGVGSV